MSEWQNVKLVEVIDDIAAGPFGSNLPKSSFTESGFPIVDGANLKGVVLTDNITKFIPEEMARSLSRSIARRGDIVVTISGTVGQLSYIPENSKYSEYLVSQRQFRCTFNKDKVFTPYLAYYFHSHEGLNKILAFANQVGVPALSQPLKNFRNIELCLPPIVEQKKIAAILSSLDDKIETNRAINAHLEELAAVIFKSWFIDFEPFADGEFIEDEYGRRPKGWEVVPLEYIATVCYGKDHKKLQDGKIPVYGSGGIMRYADSCLYKGESVLIPRKGTLNNIMYTDGEFWTVDTMFYTILKIPHCVKYFYMAIKNIDFASMNSGSAVPSMTTKILNSIKLLLPSSNVLKSFDDVLCSIFNKQKGLNNENARIAALRDALLPRLMSGELIPE